MFSKSNFGNRRRGGAHRDVGVEGLLDRLRVRARVRNDEQPRLRVVLGRELWLLPQQLRSWPGVSNRGLLHVAKTWPKFQQNLTTLTIKVVKLFN